jgi:hypothetical protein
MGYQTGYPEGERGWAWGDCGGYNENVMMWREKEREMVCLLNQVRTWVQYAYVAFLKAYTAPQTQTAVLK